VEEKERSGGQQNEGSIKNQTKVRRKHGRGEEEKEGERRRAE